MRYLYVCPLLKEKISRQIAFMSTFFNQVASQKMLNCVKEKETPWHMPFHMRVCMGCDFEG